MIHRTLAAALLLAAGAAQAEPVILTPMSDHAVIQRDKPIIVTGTADPGEALSVALGGATVRVTADKAGKWQASLPAMQAGGPHKLTVTGANGAAAALDDLLIGDVWLCSGQSNMEYATQNALNGPALVRSSADPQIRLLSIAQRVALTPDAPLPNRPQWAAAAPDSVRDFSAACYLMVKQLKAEQGVPMGAIDSSWGGTQIRPWIAIEEGRALPGNAEDAVILDQFRSDPDKALKLFADRWGRWWREQSGDKPGQEPWNTGARISWTPVPKVSAWEEWGGAMAELNGNVWFERVVTLTKDQARKSAQLTLGGINEIDTTWVNGVPVGSTFGWGSRRSYTIPAGVLKAGENRIVVAVTDNSGPGGMEGPADLLALTPEGGTAIPLGDGWRYADSGMKRTPPPRAPWESHAGLSTLYNGMIAPLGPIALKGAAWYQGESDAGKPAYDQRMAALMAGWRRQFGVADLPFLIVGLAEFGSPASKPVNSGWAVVRDEQRKAAVNDGHAAIVTAVDIGERTDIHPANKNELALRLARAATALAYGGTKSPSGPLVSGARRDGADVVVSFSGVTGSLKAWSAAGPIGFELCAADGCRFATAIAEGTTVRLTGDGKPVERVRYAWADTPVVNLYDDVPLPAVPFEVAVE